MTAHEIANLLDVSPEVAAEDGACRHSIDVRCAKVAMRESVRRLEGLELVLQRSNLPNFTAEIRRVRRMLLAALGETP